MLCANGKLYVLVLLILCIICVCYNTTLSGSTEEWSDNKVVFNFGRLTELQVPCNRTARWKSKPLSIFCQGRKILISYMGCDDYNREMESDLHTQATFVSAVNLYQPIWALNLKTSVAQSVSAIARRCEPAVTVAVQVQLLLNLFQAVMWENPATRPWVSRGTLTNHKM